jgi:hypothetical protein
MVREFGLTLSSPNSQYIIPHKNLSLNRESIKVNEYETLIAFSQKNINFWYSKN